jgi:hypothetical protein
MLLDTNDIEDMNIQTSQRQNSIRSILQTKLLTPIYSNELKINETIYVRTSSAICGMKTEHAKLKLIKAVENLSCHNDLFKLVVSYLCVYSI